MKVECQHSHRCVVIVVPVVIVVVVLVLVLLVVVLLLFAPCTIGVLVNNASSNSTAVALEVASNIPI